MGCCTVKQQMKKNYEFQVIKIVFFEEILNIPALSFGETEEGIIFPQYLSSLRRVQSPMKSNLTKSLNQSLGSNQKRVAFSPVCSQAKTRQSKLDIADTIEIRFDTNNLETY